MGKTEARNAAEKCQGTGKWGNDKESNRKRNRNFSRNFCMTERKQSQNL